MQEFPLKQAIILSSHYLALPEKFITSSNHSSIFPYANNQSHTCDLLLVYGFSQNRRYLKLSFDIKVPMQNQQDRFPANLIYRPISFSV